MTDAPPPTPAPPSAKPKKQRRTWRQRFKIFVLLLAIGVCLFRVALNVLLPTVIDRVAALFGFECGYEKLDLSLLGGNAHVWGLKVRDKATGDTIATADYIEGDLAPLELFRGRLVVYRAEVDGADVTVERDADGSLPLLKFLTARPTTAPASTTRPAAAPQAFSFAAPLRVDAMRLSHLTAKLRDKSVTPTFEATVRTGLRVSDIGTATTPTKFELDVNVDPLLDALRVTGEARLSPDAVKADVQIVLRGLHPKAAAGYLAPLGLRAVADAVTVQANASLTAAAIPNTAAVSATLALDHVSAVTDGQQWASLATLTLDAKKLSAAGIELGKLVVADGFASAEHTADGTLRMAGLELAPAATPAPTTQPLTPVAVASGPPLHLSIDDLELQRLQANVTDDAVRPAADLVARLDTLTLGPIDTDASHAATPIPLSLTAGLPGVLRSVAVRGQLTPFAPAKSVTLAVRAKGVRPDVLKPYLDRLGIVSRLQDADFTADVTATVTPDVAGAMQADARVTDVRLTDGHASLAEMRRVQIDKLTFNPADLSTSVASVSLLGPTLHVTREADGRLAAAGFKLVPPPAGRQQVRVPTTAPATRTPATVTTTPATPFALPRVEIGHLKWTGIHLMLEDDVAVPSTTFTLDDAGLELDDFLVDLRSAAAGRPGKFKAYLQAPGLADNLSAGGTFTPGVGRFTFDARVTGAGLTGERIAPYVRGVGVEPTLVNGTLRAQAKAVLTQTDNGLGVDLDLNDATYADGPTELLGVDALHVGGLSINPQGIDLDALNIRRPRARVAREANGAFRVAGIRVGVPPLTPATQPAAAATPTTAPTTAAAPTPLRLSPLPIAFGLKALNVEDATLDWSDAAAATPVDLHAVASVALNGLRLGNDAGPTRLHASAAVDGALRRATVDGTLTLSPVAPAFDLRIAADGLAAGQLTAYLPPTIQPTLHDGHFETHVAATVGNCPDGGLAARLAVDGLKFNEPGPAQSDGKADDARPALLNVDAFEAAATRIDPAAGVFALDKLTSAGVDFAARRRPDGTLEAAGVRLVAATPAAPTTQPAGAPGAGPAAVVSLPPVSLATLVDDARRPLPDVSITTLDLGVTRVALSGFTGPDAAPVTLRDVRLRSPGPLALGGRRIAEDRLQLHATGGIDPIVRRFDVSLDSKPLATEPSLALDVSAAGISGDGLTAVLPALKTKIDGGGLTDGTFTTHVDASVNYGRRGPRDFDFGRGFTATLDVKPLQFRGEPNGPVLAGLASVHGEAIKVEPANGNVSIKTIDLNTPTFRVYRDDRGLHAAGLLLPLAAQTPVETLTPASQPATEPAAPAAAPQPLPPAVAAARPTNEIRLDHFTVSGVDAVIEDRTSTPYTVVPLKSLDVDVRDLSNQLPWNGKSVRFSVLVTSDKVALPPRKGIRGVASTQQTGGEYTEQRDLFSQITADGQIGFVRRGDAVALSGWTKTAVNGFELLGVRGLAKPFGVTIGGGAFDDINDVRFNPTGLIETKNRIVFTNLSLSEPANGPLRRLLKLPTPIDVAIGAVTDPDGSITLNLPVPVKNGAVSAGDVAGPALGAVTNVLVTGIASAPLKAVGGVGNLLGLGNKAAAPEPPVDLRFLPGYDGLDGADERLVAQLVQKLRDDPTLELQLRHTLTTADVARAAVRANPTPEQCAALAAQVRQQKADLVRQHQTLAAQARGDLGAAADTQAATTLAQLHDVDVQLAKAEDALDELYALIGPGAAAQADRRTRQAALEIGRRRLDAVRDAIARSGIDHVESRLHPTNPQFDPVDAPDGGAVTVVLVRKKH